MLPELLVILACSQNKGCAETTSQYYTVNPQVKIFVKHQEAEVKKALGPTIMSFSSSIIFAIKQHGTFRLTRHFELQVPDIHTSIISFKYEF